MKRLNIGCGSFSAHGWHNIDVIETAEIRPDEIVEHGKIPAGPWGRIYCGHVLEHMPWAEVPAWLAYLADHLAPDGQIMIVGPDIPRSLLAWHAGVLPWSWVAGALEDSASHQVSSEQWDEARHHWNCSESRIVEAAELAGLRAIPQGVLDDGSLTPSIAADGWPLVSRQPGQCAVLVTR